MAGSQVAAFFEMRNNIAVVDEVRVTSEGTVTRDFGIDCGDAAAIDQCQFGEAKIIPCLFLLRSLETISF